MAAEGPILTQQAYTSLVNRLMLLLRRAEGNSRIPGKLKKRAKVMMTVPPPYYRRCSRKKRGEGILFPPTARLCRLATARENHAHFQRLTDVLRCVFSRANTKWVIILTTSFRASSPLRMLEESYPQPGVQQARSTQNQSTVTIATFMYNQAGSGGEEPRRVLVAGVGTAPSQGRVRGGQTRGRHGQARGVHREGMRVGEGCRRLISSCFGLSGCYDQLSGALA